jgi:crotonobetainyl-CoA:carnitine CoA-transferase CaiB-like acyl-CoA transferase
MTNGTESTPGRGLLTGLTVLELGDNVAGAAAAATLASFGATVTKLAEPDSPIHAHHPSRDPGGPSSGSLMSALLDDAKHFADAAAILPAIDEFDVIIVDRTIGGSALVSADLSEYLELVEQHPTPVWVTISAFGIDGSRAHLFGSEITIAAAAGLLAAVRDPVTQQPIKLAGCQALLSAGQIGALAACDGVSRRNAGQRRVHLDVSACEAAIATGPVLQCVSSLLHCTGAIGAKRYGAPAGYFPASDGMVRISAMEDHQWRGLANAYDRPDLVDRWPAAADRVDHADEIEAEVSALTAGQPKAECEAMLQRTGVPTTALYSPAELLESPQFAFRGSLHEFDVGGRTVRALGLPFTIESSGVSSRHVSASSIHGLRVAEAGHVLAAPLAGALLGAMGADVVKVEDPDRIDMYRRRGPYVNDEPGENNAAYFALVNHSKRSMTINLADDRAALATLLSSCDVFIENFGPSRARKFGLDASSLRAFHPHLLAVSSSGYGHQGPWSGYRTYAYNLHASCAMVYLTKTQTGDPVEIDLAWADLISAYALATVVAAWAIGSARHEGATIDFSMAELVAARFNEFVAAADLNGTDVVEDGTNRQPPFAPNAAFPAQDGRFVAISVLTDAHWRSLCTLLDPSVSSDDRWQTSHGRQRSQDALDEAVRNFTMEHAGRDLAALLQKAEVPAAFVVRPEDLATEQELIDRAFFAGMTHPIWGAGRVIGLPWRPAGATAISLAPPPVLGDAGDCRAGADAGVPSPWA